ncbi:DUF3263 domain-containing protein [Streptomyces sp. AJS327]|uniref:DUF3263 domain-containing protein n=1 Tax=Streptomyces sp. AJS327 TaxID=2545265 RepID=UPI0015DE4C17|nr:DUF3263 domain-containing protein [Streptomyces sp. AJS327]MBA0053898.1 DUF3263 domain-containing protein [Streptomyces sp. AJS327]
MSGHGREPEPEHQPAGGHPRPTVPARRRSVLTERDKAVLALAQRSWASPGTRERAIRERLGMSPARYFQLLNALLDDPAALEHAPMTVHRLRRLRAERRARR